MQFVVCACILLLIAFLKIISGSDMDSFGLNMINCLIAKRSGYKFLQQVTSYSSSLTTMRRLNAIMFYIHF